MNRLILIGNGFDLAHGLKTDYNSFIVWYLQKCFAGANYNEPYEDQLIKIEKLNNFPFRIGGLENTSEFVKYFYESGFDVVLKNKKDYDMPYPYDSSYFENPFKIKVKSYLLEVLILNCSNKQWVDIENEFYSLLKSILTAQQHSKTIALNNLNDSLGSIIKELEIYLGTIQPPKLHKDYGTIFESIISNHDIVDLSSESDDISSLSINEHPKKSLILNFNYTSTAEFYFNGLGGMIVQKIPVNYIHGKLGDKNNPLVFGFGDELDSDYEKIELEKINSYFQFIKSFWYFKTSNYHNLIRFIESDYFQVYILGHSCSLSDRTMLNMIFEHENCKSIKIYYYKIDSESNNFENLTQEISRHFKNKSSMRRKIVPFDRSYAMPQVKN
jgi:hypothetical protein